jgi:hypothetical protein
VRMEHRHGLLFRFVFLNLFQGQLGTGDLGIVPIFDGYFGLRIA